MTHGKISKILCIGRLSVEFPIIANIVMEADFHSINESRVLGMTNFEELSQQLSRRAETLKKQMLQESVSPLGRMVDKEFDRNGTMFIGDERDTATSTAVIGYYQDATTVKIVVEAHRLIEGHHILFTSRDTGSANYPSLRDKTLAASKQFSLLKENSLPQQAGFCVEDGYYADDGRSSISERFSLVVKFPDHPDVFFNIDSRAISEAANEPPLSERALEELPLLMGRIAGLRVLKRGDQRYADQRGYEIDIAAPNHDFPGSPIHKFVWSAEGKVNDVSHPNLEVEMRTGEPLNGAPQKSSFTDKEALEFWQRILGSLRIRPAV